MTDINDQDKAELPVRSFRIGGAPVLEFENYDAFVKLMLDLTASHRPANKIEHLLVEQLACAQWRIFRAHRVQKKNLEALDRADIDNGKGRGEIMKSVLYYQREAEKTFYRALNELRREQALRKRTESVPRPFLVRPLPAPGL